MPSYQFSDSENKVFELLPPGDYVAEVKSVEFGLQSGGKTNGSENMQLGFRFPDRPNASCSETLIFHPSCAWKVDTFVKSFNLLVDGRPPRKDDSIEFTEHMLVGLRGWVTIKNEAGTKDPSKKFNCIAVFITNKEKLTKHVELSEDDPGTPVPADADDIFPTT